MDDLTHSLRDCSREIWDDNAGWWAAQIGEGNAFQRVTVFDFSERFIEFAKDLGTPAGPAIDYRAIDATDEAVVRALGARAFDAAACNMGVMDMAAITLLARALAAALAPDGRFVFSALHPIHRGRAPSGTCLAFLRPSSHDCAFRAVNEAGARPHLSEGRSANEKSRRRGRDVFPI